MDFGEKSPIFSIFYLQKVKNGQFFPKITKNRHFGGPKKSKFEPLPRKFLTPFWTPQKPPKMAKNRVFLLFLVVFSTKITKNREIFEIFDGPPKFQILTKILKFLGPDQFTKIDLFLEIGVRGKIEIREFANFGTGRKKKFMQIEKFKFLRIKIFFRVKIFFLLAPKIFFQHLENSFPSVSKFFSLSYEKN